MSTLKEQFKFWDAVNNNKYPELTPEIKLNYSDIFLVENKEVLIEGKEVKEESPAKVTRIEVINYSKRGKQGRVFTDYDVKDFELSYQDNGRTLKIFINN